MKKVYLRSFGWPLETFTHTDCAIFERVA